MKLSYYVFEDPYFITILAFSVLTLIIDIPVIILNYHYNSNKTNILFTAFNICLTSWLRCFAQILGWKTGNSSSNEENDNLFTFCNVFAAIMVIGTISQDIWVSILGFSFHYQLTHVDIGKENEEKNKKKWFRIKILSFFIAMIIPTVIALVLFFSRLLGPGNFCCWINKKNEIFRQIFLYFLICIKWMAIITNSVFSIKTVLIIQKITSLLNNDNEKNEMNKLKTLVFSFPFNQLLEAPISTASRFCGKEHVIKKIAFVFGSIQSFCYSISFFFFTKGWDNINKMCNRSNDESARLTVTSLALISH